MGRCGSPFRVGGFGVSPDHATRINVSDILIDEKSLIEPDIIRLSDPLDVGKFSVTSVPINSSCIPELSGSISVPPGEFNAVEPKEVERAVRDYERSLRERTTIEP